MSNEPPDHEIEDVIEPSDMPTELSAEFSGILKLGQNELPCFVLSNKKRVIIMRELVNLLTGNRKGGLERYTSARGVREFMPEKYVDHPHKEAAVVFRVNNKLAYGYEATDIIQICDAYLKAREAKTLLPSQEQLAMQSEIFIRACAKVGIEALIDEATGYQAVRDANELQIKLAAYISKDLNEWTKTFPSEFFANLYRLEGRLAPIPPKAYPKRFGRYVMNFVYDTLDPDVAEWLRKNHPNPKGRDHHHQMLTQDFGQPKLRQHIMEVVGIMKASASMETFKENLARAFEYARARRRARLQQAKAGVEAEQLDMFKPL
jgi:hypothetical protein